MRNRIDQLDSLRGLAALSVFFGHIGLVTLHYPVILVAANGHSAVILFFILSGFVLSLPILERNKIDYFPFLIKRFFRIYVPYLVAIIISMTLAWFLYRGGIPELSRWFNSSWTQRPNLDLSLEHILLIGNMHSNVFNNVIWSLIHELRISLIFPFVVLFLSRLNWKFNIFICFALSIAYYLSMRYHLQISKGYHTTYYDTLHYLSMFIVGMLIAQHRIKLVNLFTKAPLFLKLIVAAISISFYEYPGQLFTHIRSHSYGNVFIDYITAIGATGIMLIALSSKPVMSFLMLKPIRHLGKVSYSLYLYHLPILLTLVYLLYGKVRLGIIYIIAISSALVIATIAWKVVEYPSLTFGRYLAKRVLAKTLLNKDTNLNKKASV